MQSELACTESLTLLASRNAPCLQIRFCSKNTACKSVGQAISQLLWEILFSVFINIVPESRGHRSGSLCARLRIHTKMKWCSIQKTYNLNIRQGSRCVQTIRQASGNGEAIASWQRWGCQEYAVRMAQPKKHCPEVVADFIWHWHFSQVLARVVCLLWYHHIQADASVWFGFEPYLSTAKIFQELFLWFSY